MTTQANSANSGAWWGSPAAGTATSSATPSSTLGWAAPSSTANPAWGSAVITATPGPASPNDSSSAPASTSDPNSVNNRASNQGNSDSGTTWRILAAVVPVVGVALIVGALVMHRTMRKSRRSRWDGIRGLELGQGGNRGNRRGDAVSILSWESDSARNSVARVSMYTPSPDFMSRRASICPLPQLPDDAMLGPASGRVIEPPMPAAHRDSWAPSIRSHAPSLLDPPEADSASSPDTSESSDSSDDGRPLATAHPGALPRARTRGAPRSSTVQPKHQVFVAPPTRSRGATTDAPPTLGRQQDKSRPASYSGQSRRRSSTELSGPITGSSGEISPTKDDRPRTLHAHAPKRPSSLYFSTIAQDAR